MGATGPVGASEQATGRDVERRGADGLRIATEEWGPPEGFPVLLLHGGGQSRQAWKATAARLAAAGYLVVASDARGHGDSEWSPTGAYAMDDFAADVLALLDRFDRPPAVVGASMGGMSALLAQGRAVEQLFAAVVLVDVTPRMELDGVARIVEFMAANPEGFATLEAAAEAISAYNPHRAKPRSSAGLERVLRQGDDGRWRWRWDPRFITFEPPSEMAPGTFEARMEEMAARLHGAASQLEAPCLLVRGAQSDLVSDVSVAEFLAAVPHASFVDISGAGHMVAGDDNDAFSAAVADFLHEHVGEGYELGQARTGAAGALRRLGHALVAHDGDTATLTELAALADGLAARLAATPTRDHLAELLGRRPGTGAEADDVEVARHTMVGGVDNPFSLEARYRRDPDGLVATATLGAGFEGAPGRAHAGAVSALITETMVAALRAEGVNAITVALDVRYLAPIPLHLPLEVRATVGRADGEQLVVACEGRAGDRAFVQASGTFAPVDLSRFAVELEGRRGA